MVIKQGRMVTYFDILLPIKSYNHMVFVRSHDKPKTLYLTMLMVTKRGRMMAYTEWLLPIKSHDHIITWFCKITWQTKIIIFINTMSMAINFDRVGMYKEEFPSIKSPDSLITWSCKVKWIILAAVSLLPLDLWTQNLTKWWLTIRNLNLLSHTTLWTRGHVRSRYELKILYLEYQNTYSYQTWQGSYIQ